MDGFDLVAMKPDNAVVKDGRITALLTGGDKGSAKEAKATVRVLADPGKAYAIYVKGGVQAELALDLPRGSYRAEWVNTKTGAVDKAEDFDHGGGTRELASPAYDEDVALRVQRARSDFGEPGASATGGAVRRLLPSPVADAPGSPLWNDIAWRTISRTGSKRSGARKMSSARAAAPRPSSASTTRTGSPPASASPA